MTVEITEQDRADRVLLVTRIQEAFRR